MYWAIGVLRLEQTEQEEIENLIKRWGEPSDWVTTLDEKGRNRYIPAWGVQTD